MYALYVVEEIYSQEELGLEPYALRDDIVIIGDKIVDEVRAVAKVKSFRKVMDPIA